MPGFLLAFVEKNGETRESIFAENMAQQGAGRKQRRPGTSLAWAGIFCWSYQSDFTNEMDKQRGSERVGKKGHPCPFFLKLPSVAISP